MSGYTLLDLIESLESPPTSPVMGKALPPAPIIPARRQTRVQNRDNGVDFLELLSRSSEVAITERDRNALYNYILTLTKEALHDFQRKSRPITTISTPNQILLFDLEVDQYGVQFEHKAGQIQERQLFLKPFSTQSSRFQIFVPPNDGSFNLTVEPNCGKFTNGRPVSLDFKLEFKAARPGKSLIDVVVEMLVQGGYRHFFAIKSRNSVSGNVIIQTQKYQDDTIIPGSTLSVPKALVRMRIMLVHSKGLETPGIFRTKGASWEVQALQAAVQKGTYFVCTDVHAISSCLKIYLRRLPPMFVNIPMESIKAQTNTIEGLSEFGLEKQDLDLILWVIDLMASVAMNESLNEISSRAIATIMAPNLFPSADDSDGGMILLMPQYVEYLHNLLQSRLKSIHL